MTSSYRATNTTSPCMKSLIAASCSSNDAKNTSWVVDMRGGGNSVKRQLVQEQFDRVLRNVTLFRFVIA